MNNTNNINYIIHYYINVTNNYMNNNYIFNIHNPDIFNNIIMLILNTIIKIVIIQILILIKNFQILMELASLII